MYLMWQLLYTFGKDISREFRDYFSAFSMVVEGTDGKPNRFEFATNRSYKKFAQIC